MDKVVNALTKYDFGLSAPYYCVFPVQATERNSDAPKVAGSARLYDFLDAGLPGVMPTNSFDKLLARYGVGIEGTKESYTNT